MADFVAVIRRAVDGLTDNTPEMRSRVYDKARSAVVRQLENMNPRPPEAMFKRQLDKLDDAIRHVEEENSEALPAEAALTDTMPTESWPAEPVAAAEPTPTPIQAAEPEPVSYAEPEPAVAAEPVAPEPAAEPVAESRRDEQFEDAHEHTADVAENAPYVADEAPVAHEQHAAHDEPEVASEPVHSEPEPAQVAVEETVAYHDEPHSDAYHAQEEELPAAATVDTPADSEPFPTSFDTPRDPAIRHAANRVMEEPYLAGESEIPGGEPEPIQAQHEAAAFEPVQYEPTQFEPEQPTAQHDDYAHEQVDASAGWNVDIDREPEVAPDPVPADEQSPPMPRATLTETDIATGFNEFIKDEFSTPAVKPPPARKEPEGDFSWDAPFDDLPDLPKPVAFDQALQARQEEIAQPPQSPIDRQRDARAELEDLIGYKPSDDVASDGQGDKISPEVARAMSKLEGKSFKVNRKAKQKFNPIPIAFGIGAALILAGGAYGAYAYRDEVSKLVASIIPSDSATTQTEVAATPAADDTSRNVVADTDETPATEDTAAKTEEQKPTEVASLDPDIAPSKFTQRLLADGSETETDAAKLQVDPALTEGKTVAGRTEVASADTSVPSTTDTTPAKTEGLTAAQRMILYEERLGDSPVAVQGKVTWRLKNDTTATGGQEQSMVEATVEVPERKLKAIVSFKRNSDASLPASHIVEVVFDLPKDFPEGNVEAVQRIAFKQTEQDRGNGLIAVPAKITDDFHMIALNDDAEARKVNVDLMKNRSWIDIPVVYRNNRRALLTFEKGATGSEAFDKALAQWAALGPTANN
jgi:hypothetical protein